MSVKNSIELLDFFKEQIKVFKELKITLTATIKVLKERIGHDHKYSIEQLEKEILEVEEKIAKYSQDASNLLKIKIEIDTLNCRYRLVSNSLKTEKEAAEEPTAEKPTAEEPTAEEPTAEKPTSETTANEKAKKGSKSKKKGKGNAKAKRQTPNVENEKEIDDDQSCIEADEAEIVVKKDEEELDASNQQKAEDLVSLEDKKKMETETKKVEKTWSSRVGNPIEESMKKPKTVVPGETVEGVWYNRDGKSFLFIKPGPKVCHVYATHGFCKCGDFTTYEHRQLIGINYHKIFDKSTKSWIYVAILPKKGDFVGLPLWVTRN
jgi:hypothetical protein